MHATRRVLNVPTVLLLVVLGSIIAYQAGAQRGQPRRPAIAATVNLPAVLEGLKQRGDAEAELNALGEQIIAEQERRQSALQALEERRQAVADERERQSIDEELALAALNYQAWLRFANEKVDVEKALLLQELYRSIKKSIQEMAAAEGYDVVLVDDSLGELTVNPESQVTREAQIRQQIISRRLLFTGTSLNITDDLIARMNNEYTAGRR
jgi:Skp family chaperone for outer membrane proteins